MKNIFNKLFHTNNSIPPKNLNDTFCKRFGNSVNVEWLQLDDMYEAVFYLNEAEHIAQFDLDGTLLNYKKNLSLNALSDNIKKKIASHGEIMNVISISDDNDITGYEIIIRDEFLIRYSLLLNANGGLMQKNKL